MSLDLGMKDIDPNIVTLVGWLVLIIVVYVKLLLGA